MLLRSFDSGEDTLTIGLAMCAFAFVGGAGTEEEEGADGDGVVVVLGVIGDDIADGLDDRMEGIEG